MGERCDDCPYRVCGEGEGKVIPLKGRVLIGGLTVLGILHAVAPTVWAPTLPPPHSWLALFENIARGVL